MLCTLVVSIASLNVSVGKIVEIRLAVQVFAEFLACSVCIEPALGVRIRCLSHKSTADPLLHHHCEPSLLACSMTSLATVRPSASPASMSLRK